MKDLQSWLSNTINLPSRRDQDLGRERGIMTEEQFQILWKRSDMLFEQVINTGKWIVKELSKGEDRLTYNEEESLHEIIKDQEKTIKFYQSRPPLTNSMIFWAFRYCLGRSTYAVMDCVDYLILYWDRIDEGIRGTIIKEIFEACDKKDCGMEQDKSQWHKVLANAGIKYTKANGWRKEEL